MEGQYIPRVYVTWTLERIWKEFFGVVNCSHKLAIELFLTCMKKTSLYYLSEIQNWPVKEIFSDFSAQNIRGRDFSRHKHD